MVAVTTMLRDDHAAFVLSLAEEAEGVRAVRAMAAMCAATIAASALVAGCVSPEDAADDLATTTIATSTTDDAAAPSPGSTTSQPDGPRLAVEAVDYSFQGLPATVAVGTRVELTNTSATELHELVAIRLDDDEERTAEELVALPQDEFLALFSTSIPDVVLVAPPGEGSIEGFGDAVFDELGRHLVLSSLPVGADPDAILESDRYLTGRLPEELQDLPLQYTLGMFAEVTVVEA